MRADNDIIAGILGGMGPEATVDLLRRIIDRTPAKDDCDHIRCLIDNNPKVPSRIKALIEGTGESPGPVMAEMGRRLERCGADFLAIACNTAHQYYDEVRDAVGIPVLHMIRLAAGEAARLAPGGRAGLLASPAVRMTKLYEEPLQSLGLTAIYPDQDWEERLLSVIRRVKAGDAGPETAAEFAFTVRHLSEKGADVCIVACTELGLLPLPGDPACVIVDAADALARAIVLSAQAG